MQNPRSEASQKAYDEFKKSGCEDFTDQQFNFANEVIVREYQHWNIIKNRFPYDTMARVNDMLVSKRAVGSFKELTDSEHSEFHQIMEELAKKGTYDAKIENFTQAQSVKKHLHIHLVKWLNTNDTTDS